MCRSIVAESLGTCTLTCSEIKKFTRAYLYPTVMCSPCDSVTSKLISGLIVDDFCGQRDSSQFHVGKGDMQAAAGSRSR